MPKLGMVLVAFAIFLSSSLAMSQNVSANADTSIPHPSYIGTGAIDPTTGTFYILWTGNTTENEALHISSFDVQGHPIQNFTLPKSAGWGTGFAFINGTARYYFGGYAHSVETLFYIDLNSGRVGTINNPSVNLRSCNFNYGIGPEVNITAIYNPQNHHLYLPCDQGDQEFVLHITTNGLAIDTQTDTVVANLPYFPLAYNPQINRVYAVASTLTSNLDGTETTASRLVSVDAATENLQTAVQVSDFGTFPSLAFSVFNGKTNNFSIGVQTCTRYRECQAITQFWYDANGNKKSQTAAIIQNDGFINSSTNQLYGFLGVDAGQAAYIALDANNPTPSGKIAQFKGRPVAVDPTHNVIYVADETFRTAFEATNQKEPGLGIMVMDATRFDVIRFLPVRPPDPIVAAYTQPTSSPPNSGCYYFKEVGHSLCGKFLTYWLSHGGLSIFGYPKTEPFVENNLTIQYFERQRFELHPENAGTPYEVLLGLVGTNFSARTAPVTTPPPAGGWLLKETGHTLSGAFLSYWQAHGGLPVFGLPLTEPYTEVSPIDGKSYTVQYFERARFEYHPEYKGTEYEVELGLLGTQLLRSRAWPV